MKKSKQEIKKDNTDNYDSIHTLIMSPGIASAIKTTPKDGLHPVLYCKNIVVSKYMSDTRIVCLDEVGNFVREFFVYLAK